MAFKLFRSSSESEPETPRERSESRSPEQTASPSAQRHADGAESVRALSEQSAQELPTGSGLPELVALMDRYGVRTLRLDQHGNEMTAVMDPSEKPERRTTVDTESTWFDAVASLYTAAQAGQRGPWRRAEIMVGTARDGRRPVETEYTYPGSEEQDRFAYVQTVPREQAESAPEASGAGTPGAASSEADAEAAAPRGRQETADAEPVLGTPAARTEAPRQEEADRTQEPSEDASASTEATGTEGSARATTAGTAAVGATGAVAASGAALDAEHTAPGEPSAAETDQESRAPEATGSRAAGSTGAEQAGAEQAPAAPSAPAEAQSERAQPVPAVVPESTWEQEHPEHAGEERERAEDALPDSAPSVAEHADVAPSYHAPAQAPAKPSETRLAPGNLVLTEAQVVSRLAEAQRALFGPQGTARDVSTVLIRVRALGSYYDALTHVRGNGLWDQRSTFQLVPEEALQVLALKADSYQEGEGSPIAMMFRFTPGIPPEVSFDYADEERYVQYKDRLPAQQYVEELRMYPRTGSNIPEHMNEALTQWSL